jgi:hypothetical protein
MKIGDWVRKMGTSRIGAITQEDTNTIHVQWVQDKGEIIAACGWISKESVVLLPLQLQKEDYAAMIDFALDTNDKNWFKALVWAANAKDRVDERL